MLLVLTTTASHAGKKGGRPWLGVSMSRPAGGGVMVQHVFRTSPAEKADLRQGDRLTEVDGVKLDKPSELVRHVARLKPGMSIRIGVRRGGRDSVVRATLAEYPGRDQILRLMHVGREAYELSGLTAIQGNMPASIKNLRGKVVLLDFFAGWCVNCKRMTPEIARLDRTYKSRGLAVLSVTSDAEGRARAVVKDWKIPYAVASDRTKQTFSAYSVTAIPAVFLIGKKGKIREVIIGDDTSARKRTEKLIKKLLAEK